MLTHLKGIALEQSELQTQVEPQSARRPQLLQLLPLLSQPLQGGLHRRYGTGCIHLGCDAGGPAKITHKTTRHNKFQKNYMVTDVHTSVTQICNVRVCATIVCKSCERDETAVKCYLCNFKFINNPDEDLKRDTILFYLILLFIMIINCFCRISSCDKFLTWENFSRIKWIVAAIISVNLIINLCACFFYIVYYCVQKH